MPRRCPLWPAALSVVILTSLTLGCGGTEPPAVAAIQPVSGNAQIAVAGRALPQPLVVEVKDERGDPIPDVDLQFTITQGGGQVEPAEPTTDDQGRAAVTYTLGPTPGAAQLTVSASGTDLTAVFTATATSAPASVVVSAGNGQSAGSGVAVPVAPAVTVLDAGSQPVPGVTVRFQVAQGGGSVSATPKVTNASGVATADQWLLGPAGINTLEATVEGETLAGEPVTFVATTSPATGFDIIVRYSGNPTSDQILAFAEAELRWEQVITADLSDGPVNVPAGTCGPGTPAINELVDDLVIFAAFKSIDGPGNILAQAGPCLIRDNNGNSTFEVGDLPGVGIMNFDVDDLDFAENQGILSAVVLHEMGHVLGIGSLWRDEGLLADPVFPADPDGPPNLDADPHFTGDQALAAFNAAGGTNYNASEKVPVENCVDINDCSRGTADGHWRESVFGNELMTGIVDLVSNPMSAITVSSLTDQGYEVDEAQADPYSLDLGLRIAGKAPAVKLHRDILRLPLHRFRPTGR